MEASSFDRCRGLRQGHGLGQASGAIHTHQDGEAGIDLLAIKVPPKIQAVTWTFSSDNLRQTAISYPAGTIDLDPYTA
jgi:hypothetical protein